jgi:hypothetical protein
MDTRYILQQAGLYFSCGPGFVQPDFRSGVSTDACKYDTQADANTAAVLAVAPANLAAVSVAQPS